MMRFAFAVLAAALAAAPALAAGVSPAERPFLGTWTGTLTYRDYQSNKRVVLPTTLAVRPDGDALRFAYVYQDGPHKVVRSGERVALDARRGTYVASNARSRETYRAIGLGSIARAGVGRMSLYGPGTDNDKPVEVRETFDVGPRSLVIRFEVRPRGGTYFTRHIYRFTRRPAP